MALIDTVLQATLPKTVFASSLLADATITIEKQTGASTDENGVWTPGTKTTQVLTCPAAWDYVAKVGEVAVEGAELVIEVSGDDPNFTFAPAQGQRATYNGKSWVIRKVKTDATANTYMLFLGRGRSGN